jgi:hypothetical protein
MAITDLSCEFTVKIQDFGGLVNPITGKWIIPGN